MAKPGQLGQRSTDKVQRKKKSCRGHGCLPVVSVVCLSGRGLCDGLITRPEESYRLCCVIVCDQV
jgi:hypothetical protein